MHVKAVANELGPTLLGFEHRARHARRTVRHRRHAIEEMRRVRDAGVDRGARLLVGGPAVANRDAMAASRQLANEIEAAVQLRAPA